MWPLIDLFLQGAVLHLVVLTRSNKIFKYAIFSCRLLPLKYQFSTSADNIIELIYFTTFKMHCLSEQTITPLRVSADTSRDALFTWRVIAELTWRDVSRNK